MKIELLNCGQNKIACIKAIHAGYGFDLRTSKDWSDRTPCILPQIDDAGGAEMVKELRAAGARVIATCETTAIDKLTASSFIQTAATALGEGNIRDTRLSLRAALRLIDDYGLDDDIAGL